MPAAESRLAVGILAQTRLRAVLAAACAARDLTAQDAVLLRHYANAVYLLSDPQLVVRINYWPGAAECAGRAVALTRWLVGQGFPATEPADTAGPVLVSVDGVTAAATFWRYYPQPDPPRPCAHTLGQLLVRLHRLSTPPMTLPPYRPLHSLHAALTTSASQPSHPGLTSDDRRWLLRRIAVLRTRYHALGTLLGYGLIHNDAHPDNLLHAPPPHPLVLGDWDTACLGPRELDLIPTAFEPRFGAPEVILDQLAAGYGHDIRRLPGYRMLYQLYALRTLTALIRHAPHDPAAAHELAHRISTLRRDTREPWNPH